jgi:diguanylate cyclase (GGDEF)-like protein/PAS domain S-box-containing protein
MDLGQVFLDIALAVAALGFAFLALFFYRKAKKNTKKRHGSSDDNYVSLVKNYPGMAYRCLNDEYWTMKYMSPKTEELVEYSIEEVIDNHVISFEEIIMPKYRKELREKWAIAIRENSDFTSEYQIITKSGRIKWVQETGHVVFDKNGTTEYIEGFIRDITEEHELVIKERKSEAKYRNLIETIQDPIYIDKGGVLVYVNPACVRFFRADSDMDLLGKKVVDLIKPEYVQFYSDRFERLGRTKMPNPRADYAYLRFDGTIAYAEVSSSPHFDNGEMSVHVLIYDVTEKKFRMEQLRRIQKRNRDLILQMSEGIGIFSDDNCDRVEKLVYSNRSFSRILFGSQRKVIGLSIDELFGTSSMNVHSILEEARRDNVHVTQSVPYDNDRYLEVRAFYNDDKELVIMVSDISELIRFESTLLAERNRLQTIIRGTNTAIWELNWKDQSLIVNERWPEIVGYHVQDLTPYTLDTWVNLIHPEDKHRFISAIHHLLADETDDILEEIRMVHRQGQLVWTVVRGTMNKSGTNLPSMILSGIMQDITDRKEKELEILHLSYYDYLTGLFNRRKYEEILKEVDQSGTLPLSIIMTDVDALKITNDAFGHQAGDHLLKHITSQFVLNFPPEAYISRIGGDEFVVILPNTAFSQAKKAIDLLNDRLKQDIFNGIPCSVSYGVATRTTMKTALIDVIRDAEMIMYDRKLMQSGDYRSGIIEIVKRTFFDHHPEERIHANLVKKYVFQLGKEFHLSEMDLNSLLLLAEIHDIGKIALPKEILLKPSPINQEEAKQIQHHAETGYRILVSSYEYDKIAVDVLSHHERWDGNGYPKKICEDEIPWKARFLSICEAYAAMIQTFPYRPELTPENAAREIVRGSGSQFDPEIAHVFVEKVLKRPWSAD